MSVQKAFEYCEQLTRSHYENFPIGWFVPKSSKPYLYAVYAFARTADDFSDEDAFRSEGMRHLDLYERKLQAAARGQAEDPLFVALAETFQKTSIPPALLADLLKAFRMDLVKNRYATWQELETYCVYSANPVGRIVLLLYGYEDPELHRLSDRICTGIQLVNHWQDIAMDLKKDRVYLPAEDMSRFGYSIEKLFQHTCDDTFRSLMRFEVGRARSLFEEGRPLLEPLAWRLRLQVGLMWKGPMKILDRIESAGFDVFRHRPRLGKMDWLGLLL